MSNVKSNDGKRNDSSNGNWQTVITKAQKKSAKKTEEKKRVQLGKMETVDLRNFGSNLMKKVGANGIILQRLGEKQCPRIICETEESERKVIDHLTAGGIEFNSFNNRESKKRAYIIRGVLGESDDEAMTMIENAVRDSLLHTNASIHRQITRHFSNWWWRLVWTND